MRIKYERTGGFAGMTMTTEFDLADLPPDHQQKLQDLLKICNFRHLPEKIWPPQPGIDQFSYRIEINEFLRHHTLETTDSAAPETVRPLIDFLGELARSRRGQKPSSRG